METGLKHDNLEQDGNWLKTVEHRAELMQV